MHFVTFCVPKNCLFNSKFKILRLKDLKTKNLALYIYIYISLDKTWKHEVELSHSQLDMEERRRRKKGKGEKERGKLNLINQYSSRKKKERRNLFLLIWQNLKSFEKKQPQSNILYSGDNEEGPDYCFFHFHLLIFFFLATMILIMSNFWKLKGPANLQWKTKATTQFFFNNK